MSKTQLGLVNALPSAPAGSVAPQGFSVTDNLYQTVAADVTNGLQFVDFFESIDDSSILIVNNPSTTQSCIVTLLVGENLAGTSDSMVGNNAVYEGNYNSNQSITVPASKQYSYPIRNSSRFGTQTTDSSSNIHMGLNFNITVTDSSHYPQVMAAGIYPQEYQGCGATL